MRENVTAMVLEGHATAVAAQTNVRQLRQAICLILRNDRSSG
jgi:hypothetical protein